MERWELTYFLIRDPWPSHVAYLTLFSIPSWLCWVMISRIPRTNLVGQPCRRLPVVKAYGVILAVVAVCFLSLNHYKSLQDAVESNDVGLTERRLRFNLAGLGANDGSVTDNGTGGLTKGPLLPTAVGKGNKALVELLIQHGAELNPGAPDVIKNFYSYADNALAVAIRHDNMEMVELLIEKGANPTQGVFQAVSSEKPDYLCYLMGHGADMEVAREQFRKSDTILKEKRAPEGEPWERKFDRMLQAVDEPIPNSERN